MKQYRQVSLFRSEDQIKIDRDLFSPGENDTDKTYEKRGRFRKIEGKRTHLLC